MSLDANRISLHIKAASEKYFGIGAKPGTKPAAAADVRDFCIDASTSLIDKCPAGRAPQFRGISKGQTCAHFPLEACTNCEYCGICPSKQQAKGFVVRINLKAIENGRAIAPSKPADAAEAVERPRIKNKAAAMLREHGIVASAAVLFLLIGIAAFPGVAHQVSDDPLPPESAAEIESAEMAADVAFPDIGETLPDPAAGSVLDTDGGDPSQAGSEDSNDPSLFPDSAQSGDGSEETDLSEDVDSQEPDPDDSAETDAEDDTAESGASGSAPSAIAGAQSATAAPRQLSAAPAPDPKSLPYLIYVSKNSYTIAILGQDEDGEYTELLRTFNTAIGRTSAQTRAGNYTITGRERWRDWGGGSTYTPYSTRHSGGLFFHGPVFTAKDSYSLKASSYNEIGTSATSGCMRTYTAAAAWIYYNCPDGTPVVIANDSKYTSATQANVDSKQKYDPTDPDIKKEIPQVSFKLNYSAVELEVDESLALEVSSITPADAMVSGFAYSSDDNSIAAVDSDGVITAVGPGTATVTVAVVGSSEASQTCQVTVAQPEEAESQPEEAESPPIDE